MAVKITDLPAEAAPTGDDLIIIRDNATGTTRKIPISTLLLAFSDLYAPTGAVINFAGATAPSGWLLCDGAPIDRTTYADLYALIGTTYGNGNGLDTFNIPDMRGRVAVGKAASGTFGDLNDSGGEETHTQLVTEMPVHTHTQNAHAHSASQSAHNHSVGSLGTSGGWGVLDSPHASSSGTQWSSTAQPGVTVNAATASNNNSGGGVPFNILSPYRVLNSIIKV